MTLSDFESPPPRRQPMLNLPGVMILLLAVLAGIHVVRAFFLDASQDIWVILNFAYFPARPTGFFPPIDVLSGAEIWSYLTYGLLHADWGHLLVNAFWMAAFGSPLAWRFGPARFLAFSAVAVVAGALVHLLAHGGEEIPLVGASAAVSAHMAGAARFLFIATPGMPRSYRTPAASLAAVFTDVRTLTFLGVWIAINLAVGLFGAVSEDAARIAWEAHVGGFLVGLLLFPLFDPVPRQATPGRSDG
jgi:membrane associated rhomboid family serine protease